MNVIFLITFHYLFIFVDISRIFKCDFILLLVNVFENEHDFMLFFYLIKLNYKI